MRSVWRGTDAVVVGAGPNGLAAAITLAQAGVEVQLLEAAETAGGGLRSAELTLPGFVHDVCAAIHPLGVASPVFRALPLAAHGLEWIHPPVPMAHPFEDGSALRLERSVAATAAQLGEDGAAYSELLDPCVRDWDRLAEDVLGPPAWPRHPVAAARFGRRAIRSATGLGAARFRGERARALLAGLAAHSGQPLEAPLTAGLGLVLATLAHLAGWPLVRGGSQGLADALAGCFTALGGAIRTGSRIARLADLPSARAALLDVTPRQLLRIAGPRLPAWYRRRLAGFRYGPGVFKVDWALAGPIPWRAAECALAATVHVGGTAAEIAAAERAPWRGGHAARPFVLVTQPSLFDASRAPAGAHTAWGYCHVPLGSPCDMTERIEAQVERFAPGFRQVIRARSVRGPAALEAHNANYIGGDIGGGAGDWRQLITRPIVGIAPYAVPAAGLYLCSSSTPPGGGVHGLCGWHAARAALHRERFFN
ncbi:MAG: phytoene desaturase family protein [Gemmatimonadota bacterium]